MKFTHEVTRRFMVVAANVPETEVIEVQRFQHFHDGPGEDRKVREASTLKTIQGFQVAELGNDQFEITDDEDKISIAHLKK